MMAAIILLPHGTGCCGITHLFLGDTVDPAVNTTEMKKYSPERPMEGTKSKYAYVPGVSPTWLGQSVVHQLPAFSLDRPVESTKDRVVALVTAWTAAKRGGVIEAVTNSKQKAWEPVLEELGFVRAVSTVNPNSHKTITVWLLDYGKEAGTGALDPKGE